MGGVAAAAAVAAAVVVVGVVVVVVIVAVVIVVSLSTVVSIAFGPAQGYAAFTSRQRATAPMVSHASQFFWSLLLLNAASCVLIGIHTEETLSLIHI